MRNAVFYWTRIIVILIMLAIFAADIFLSGVILCSKSRTVIASAVWKLYREDIYNYLWALALTVVERK